MYAGSRPGSRVVEIVTVAKLLPLVVLVAAGLWLSPVDPRSWLPAPSARAVGQTAILLIFAFVGIEVALVPSGEIRDPARTVPRAAFVALAFTTLLYLAIQAVAQAVLGESMTDYAAAPLARSGVASPGPGRPAPGPRRGSRVDVRLLVRRHAVHAARDLRVRPRRLAAEGLRERSPAPSHAVDCDHHPSCHRGRAFNDGSLHRARRDGERGDARSCISSASSLPISCSAATSDRAAPRSSFLPARSSRSRPRPSSCGCCRRRPRESSW